MNPTGNNVDNEGNTVYDEHAQSSRDKRDRFQKKIALSMDELHSLKQDEKSVYEYLRNKQCIPETLDEICRQTCVDTRYVMQWLETMMAAHVVERQVTCGVSRYVLTEDGRSETCRPGSSIFGLQNTKKQDETKDMCNDLNGNETLVRVEIAEDSNVSAEELEQHLEEGCWVLLNGCDSGEFVAGLAKKFPHTSFIALHKNRKALKTIMETCMQLEAYNVNFQEEDPASLPNSWIQCFDWVILYDVIQGVSDVEQTLTNTRRVLKKNGVLSITFTPNASQQKDADVTNYNDTGKIQTETSAESCDLNSSAENGATRDTANGEINGECTEGCLDFETVQKMLSDAMFEIIRSDTTNSEDERMHIMCTVNSVV